MAVIKNVVERVIEEGYLSVQSEHYLCHLFHLGCDLEDLEALAKLQQAVTRGWVKRLTQEVAELVAD